MVTRNDIIVPEFYKKYINTLKDAELPAALASSTSHFDELLKEIPKEKRDFAYAEGKWTLRQLLQHVIDTERVFAFRALWFARRSPAPQAGFDENAWAAYAPANRKWKKMVKVFKSLRKANESLFESFNDDELKASGSSNNNVLSVAACGFIAAGHLEHHIGIIRERYLGN